MQKALVFVFAGTVLVAGASAQVGKWNGKLSMKMPDPKTIKDPNQRKQTEAIIAQMKSFTIKMELRADKTAVMTTPATKMGGQTRPASTATGTWSVSGNTVNVVILKTDGKAVPKEQSKPQAMTLSADKKTLTMSPAQAPGNLKIIFTKA